MLEEKILRTAPLCVLLFFLSAATSFSQPAVIYSPLVTGLNQPIEVVTAPGDISGRIFIVLKPGRIVIWNGSTVLATPFLNIESIVADGGEQGLLSMAFHPQYQTNGYFFVYYNDNSGNITVARYQVSADPNVANPLPNPVTPLISITKPFTNHNGGHLQFKTEGGINYLYFATGDGGSGNDPNNNAQNLASNLGKMIRMNVDAPTPTAEIWSWGLRNPFRWSFDRLNGDMWIGDVGQNQREEISFLPGGVYGANFGWVCMEADIVNTGAPSGIQCDTVFAVDIPPIFAYPNPASGSSSVIGGYVYRGTEFPNLYGWYVTADFYSGRLWLIRPNGSGGWDIAVQNGLAANIASFSETNDGTTIYAVSLSGTVYKLEAPIPTPLTLLRFSGNAGQGFNDLIWTAESEQDIDKFEIEFSTNGIDFTKAGEVNSLNNGNRNHYSFRHPSQFPGSMQYRLKVLEFSGRHFYSPVISLRNEKRKLNIYPSILSTRTLQLNSSEPITSYRIINSEGRVLVNRSIERSSGYFTIETPVLRKGIYFIQLNSARGTFTEKFLVN